MACYCIWHKSGEVFFTKIGTFQRSENGPPKLHLCCGGISADGIQIDWIMFSLRRRNVITTWWALSTEKHSPARHVRVQTAPFFGGEMWVLKGSWHGKTNVAIRLENITKKNSKIATVGKKVKWIINKLERMKNIDVERWETLTKIMVMLKFVKRK